MKRIFTKLNIGRKSTIIILGIVAQFLVQSFFALPVYSLAPDTLWSEDWEMGIGSWYADNGLWETGNPTVGPDSGHLSSNCVGTLVNDNYPVNANTRLISPSIKLPIKNPDEKIQLKLWHWFRTKEHNSNYPYSYNPDKCIIQISVNSGKWRTLLDYCSGVSPVWTQVAFDISAYAYSTIRLGFYFYSTGNNEDNGWYIDDINIVKSVVSFNNPEDFENGVGDWSADNGLWEVGSATVGPKSPHSGVNVAGIDLNRNYPANANTRLISPATKLPTLGYKEKIQLKLWHWFRTKEHNSNYPYSYNPDKCYIQISVNSGSWKTLLNPCSGVSMVWTQVVLDISAYADSTIRIGFYFTSTGNNEDAGWYIDNISIEKSIVVFNNPEDFENGVGDWSADNGLWEVGVPGYGPPNTHSGNKCAGINLNGNYPANANSRFISPEITLTPKEGQNPELFFWHWFRMKEHNSNYPYSYNPDYGYIQIKTKNSDWQTIGDTATGISPAWTQAHADLSAYADSTVRIGFYFTSTGNNEDNGWYIEDIRIEGIDTSTFINEFKNTLPLKFFLYQSYPNPFNPVTHIPFSLPKAANVRIEVFNLLGQRVAVLLNERKQAGYHTAKFDGSNFSSGVYFYRIVANSRGEAGAFSQMRKMLLVK
jgi:hypothetical protein